LERKPNHLGFFSRGAGGGQFFWGGLFNAAQIKKGGARFGKRGRGGERRGGTTPSAHFGWRGAGDGWNPQCSKGRGEGASEEAALAGAGGGAGEADRKTVWGAAKFSLPPKKAGARGPKWGVGAETKAAYKKKKLAILPGKRGPFFGGGGPREVGRRGGTTGGRRLF